MTIASIVLFVALQRALAAELSRQLEHYRLSGRAGAGRHMWCFCYQFGVFIFIAKLRTPPHLCNFSEQKFFAHKPAPTSPFDISKMSTVDS